MREEYNFENARKNPYAQKLKRQITINVDSDTVDYFKGLAESAGLPYQTLMNLYLRDCADHRRTLQVRWE
jgi:uncharacterized protein (DUF4415 family)